MKTGDANNTFFGLRFIATADETNGQYFLSTTTIPAQDPGPPMHAHAHEDESFYLQKGSLKFTLNGKEIRLKQGEFLHVERGERHTWRNDSQEEAEVLVIFTPAGIERMFVELDNHMSQIKEIGLKFGTNFEL